VVAVLAVSLEIMCPRSDSVLLLTTMAAVPQPKVSIVSVFMYIQMTPNDHIKLI